MRRYLLIAIAVLFVGLNASENPFDESENSGNIDEEQSMLLSELKSASNSEKKQRDKIIEEVDVANETNSGINVDAITQKIDNRVEEIKSETPKLKTKEQELLEVEAYERNRAKKREEEAKVAVKEPIIVEDDEEEISPVLLVDDAKEETKPVLVEETKPVLVEKLMDKPKEEPKPVLVEDVKPVLVEEPKEEIKPVLIEEIKNEVKEKAKQEEATKDDVEITIIKPTEEKKATPKQEIKEVKEVKKEIKKPETVAPKTTEKVPAPLDINVTREKQQEKINADILYQKAIEEMDRDED